MDNQASQAIIEINRYILELEEEIMLIRDADSGGWMSNMPRKTDLQIYEEVLEDINDIKESVSQTHPH